MSDGGGETGAVTDREVPEGGVLVRMINYQLVIVCLLYDVSEMNAINLIGWSARRCSGLLNMRVPQRRRCSVLCSKENTIKSTTEPLKAKTVLN